MWRFIIIIALLLTMTGCNAPIDAHDVAGTWVMKEESRKWLPPEIEKSMGKITMLADGTFAVYELPQNGYFDSGEYVDKWRTLSGSGKWKLLLNSGLQLYLWFNKISVENADDQDVSEGFQFGILERRSTIYIYYYYDPTTGPERIEFEKITQ